MGKKVVALLMAIVMLASALSLTAFADMQTSDGLWNYSMTEGGATILKYNGADTVPTIPEKLGEYPTKSISAFAFQNTPASVINLPESVTDIEDEAFSSSSVEAVYCPASLVNFPAVMSDSGITLYSFTGTAAQTYAENNGLSFVKLAKSPSYSFYVGKSISIDCEQACTLTALDKCTTISAKNVKAVKAGNASVRITLENGIAGIIKFSIKAAPKSIEYASVINLYVGDIYTKKPTISNGSYPAEDFTFKSANTSIASVDKSGNIKAVKPGSTTVTVSYTGGLSKKTTVNVGKVTSVFNINASQYLIGVGETKQLSYTIGKNEIVKKVTYTSSNEKVATVSTSGKIVAKGVGVAVITAQTYNGLKQKCTVTVGKAPSSIKLARTAIMIAAGEKVKFKVSINSGAVCSQYIWRSGDESVFTVDQNGNVKGVRPGTAKLYCYTYNYKSKDPYIRADAKITVKKAPSSISFNKTSIVLGVGEQFDLNVKLPSGADCYKKTTSVSKTGIIKIGKGLVVTGKKVGTTMIYVTTFNGKVASCKITVKNAPKKVACKPTTIKLALKEKYQLHPYVNNGSVCSSYIYKTSNSKVCTVSANGTIKAVDYGSCYIKVYCYNHTRNNPVMCQVKVNVGYITNKVASYTTYFDPYYYGKAHNLKTACNYINGKTDGYILQPGEVFSYNDILGPRTSARGYTTAKVIEGGGYVDGMGGGICQGATTIFNATLLANLGIIERHQHQLRSSYCPLGRDAAISWGVEDYVFKNTYNTPIRVKMNYDPDGAINCSIYSLKKVNLPKIRLDVTQNGYTFTLRRYAGGKCNYTTYSTY